jgi:hypothetical protein
MKKNLYYNGSFIYWCDKKNKKNKEYFEILKGENRKRREVGRELFNGPLCPSENCESKNTSSCQCRLKVV